MVRAVLLVVVVFFAAENGSAQKATKTSFKIVPLGVKGGLNESNLSAYMIAERGSDDFICVDAGTVRTGIEQAIRNKVFHTAANRIFKNYIKAYLISHGHLDHVSGLIINSPDDTVKNIYAMPYVIDVLRDRYFTWESWANFADQGEKPALGKYRYQALAEQTETAIENTGMHVRAFSLSHSAPYQSTAFLLTGKENSVLYFGDTGSDRLEKSHKIFEVWKQVAPMIKNRHLKAIFIEVSFPNEQPEKQLFGHLTPTLLMQELDILDSLAGRGSLKSFPILVTHIKPAAGAELQIREQLKTANRLQVKLVYPVQGQALEF